MSHVGDGWNDLWTYVIAMTFDLLKGALCLEFCLFVYC